MTTVNTPSEGTKDTRKPRSALYSFLQEAGGNPKVIDASGNEIELRPSIQHFDYNVVDSNVPPFQWTSLGTIPDSNISAIIDSRGEREQLADILDEVSQFKEKYRQALEIIQLQAEKLKNIAALHSPESIAEVAEALSSLWRTLDTYDKIFDDTQIKLAAHEYRLSTIESQNEQNSNRIGFLENVLQQFLKEGARSKISTDTDIGEYPVP